LFFGGEHGLRSCQDTLCVCVANVLLMCCYCVANAKLSRHTLCVCC
jgi:hypothetical protein